MGRKKGNRQGPEAGGAQGGVQKLDSQNLVDKNKAHELATLPRKKMYRARAHSNPLSDQILDVPKNPAAMDWCVSGIYVCMFAGPTAALLRIALFNGRVVYLSQWACSMFEHNA